MTDPSIEQRLRAVEDRDAIRELTARYCFLVREADAEGLAALFCEDGVFEMSDRVLRGRDELRGMYAAAGDTLELLPFIQNHVIELDGDRAHGRCSVEIRLVQNGQAYTAAGDYDDTYRRVDGTWLFERRILELDHWVPLSEGWARPSASGPPPLER